jgi:hypothetical protein
MLLPAKQIIYIFLILHLSLLWSTNIADQITRLWIGIVLMPIRIWMSMLMPIQTRIRIGNKIMPILKRILPQVSSILKNPNFVFTISHSYAS